MFLTFCWLEGVKFSSSTLWKFSSQNHFHVFSERPNFVAASWKIMYIRLLMFSLCKEWKFLMLIWWKLTNFKRQRHALFPSFRSRESNFHLELYLAFSFSGTWKSGMDVKTGLKWRGQRSIPTRGCNWSEQFRRPWHFILTISIRSPPPSVSVSVFQNQNINLENFQPSQLSYFVWSK